MIIFFTRSARVFHVQLSLSACLAAASIAAGCSVQEKNKQSHGDQTNDATASEPEKNENPANQNEGDPQIEEILASGGSESNGEENKKDNPVADATKGEVAINKQEAPQLSPSDPAVGAGEEFTILDFNDGQLRNREWLAKQRKNSVHTFVDGKGDSGVDKLSLALGEGLGGSPALAVEYQAKLNNAGELKGSGLPGFWVIRGRSDGQNATSREGYLLPNGRRANQIEFSLKFPRGFRKAATSSPKLFYPNHQNFVMGTYHFDPALIDGREPVKESNNWHFYHKIYLRHDKADGDWIRVVLNDTPQHQRGETTKMPAVNPTANAGNYYEIMTRFYLDCLTYYGDPEIPAEQVRMLVDDIKFRYVPPKQEISLAFNGIANASQQAIKTNRDNLVYFTVRNDGDKEFSGRFGVSRAGGANVKIQGVDGKPLNDTRIPAKSSVTYVMIVNAPSPSKGIRAGVSLISLDQIRSDATSNTRSLGRDHVEKRWFSQQGPHDAEIKGKRSIIGRLT